MAKFYRKSDENIKGTTINWHIYELVRIGILERTSRGQFRMGQMKPFEPEPSKHLLKLCREITAELPYIQLCIWETNWLNDLAQHLSNKSIIILEMERDSCEAVFHKLQSSNKTVFLEPTIEIMERYVAVENRPIVVKAMISEASFPKIGRVNSPIA